MDKSSIAKIKKGFYSAVYFNRTKYILEQEKNVTPVTMQVFQWNNRSILCGIDEVIELLRDTTEKPETLTVRALRDGDTISKSESVMHVIGPYVYFAHFESLYLGILARRTSVATLTRRVVDAARGKPVFFFADRFDYFLNQEGDGYAAHVGGAAGVCTLAQASRWNGIPIGTIPHSLIVVNNGNTVTATKLFAKYIPDANLVALVGLVHRALTDNGFSHVKILVSGGFNEEKVRWFEKEKTPVDGYGVGSALVHGSNDFTADIVRVDGEKIAKAGRRYGSNRRFRSVRL